MTSPFAFLQLFLRAVALLLALSLAAAAPAQAQAWQIGRAHV